MSHTSGYEVSLRFHKFIGDLIAEINDGEILVNLIISGREVDYAIRGRTEDWIIEVKANNIPLTSRRLREVRIKFDAVSSQWEESTGRKPKLILALKAPLTHEKVRYLEYDQIEVWDPQTLLAMLDGTPLMGRAAEFFPDDAGDLRIKVPSTLADKLQSIPAGKQHWAQYQNLCSDILEYLFCPPLAPPIKELSNEPRVNRRDIILPNYCTDGFFSFLRTRYRAEHLVIDAKNHTKEVKKADILQLANYLSEHGAGLFGIILTRYGAARGAEQTQREQWILHQKMICVLNDADIFQMLTSKGNGSDPAMLIRQKIEDFRLSF